MCAHAWPLKLILILSYDFIPSSICYSEVVLNRDHMTHTQLFTWTCEGFIKTLKPPSLFITHLSLSFIPPFPLSLWIPVVSPPLNEPTPWPLCVCVRVCVWVTAGDKWSVLCGKVVARTHTQLAVRELQLVVLRIRMSDGEVCVCVCVGKVLCLQQSMMGVQEGPVAAKDSHTHSYSVLDRSCVNHAIFHKLIHIWWCHTHHSHAKGLTETTFFLPQCVPCTLILASPRVKL